VTPSPIFLRYFRRAILEAIHSQEPGVNHFDQLLVVARGDIPPEELVVKTAPDKGTDYWCHLFTEAHIAFIA